MEKKKSLLLFLLILGTAFWGLSFSVTKLAIGNSSPFLFLFYRFFFATLVLTLIFWKQVKTAQKQALIAGAGLAIPLTAGIFLQTLGIKYTSASQCAFIAGTSVIIIPLIKLLFYRSTAPLKIWVAALIALTGLFIISVTKSFTIGAGDLFTIAGSFGFAIYLIQVEQQTTKMNLLPAIVPMFATCTVLALMMALTSPQNEWFPSHSHFWTGIVFCALFSTAYMYTISNISQRYISAERVAIIYLFEPIFGAVGAYFILDEQLTWRLVIGGALIFIATLIAELKLKPRHKQDPTIMHI